MCRRKIVTLWLLLVFASLSACGNSAVDENVPPKIETPCEISYIVLEYDPGTGPVSEQGEPPSLPQESKPLEPEAHELCDCGAFYAHQLQPFKSTPPLNIRESDHPFGFGTHFTYQFETIHEATYLQWEAEFSATLIIWSDEPLRDFWFVSVHHNAICCAYVGEILLAVDTLYPSDAVALTVAFWHYLYPRGGIMFTDANGVRHRMFIWESMAGGCASRYYLGYTDNLIDLRENWLDLEIISIPGVFTYDKGGLHNDIVIITNCPFVPSENVWDATHMWAGYLKVESIESMVESSLTAREFLFDDGYIGYMLEFEYDIWWVREDWMAVSFRHGGYRTFFEIHEDLILAIARTLTAR